jgi:two-component system chemotaxis response regulator CheY
MKLLIVDDSNVIRQRIARIARDPRLPTFTIVGMARDGTEAYRLARLTVPDLVTMDLTMPGMDGVTCTATLVDSVPSIQILVISALSDKATALRALKKGAQGFLYKPFTDDQLVSALLQMVNE